MAAAVFFAGVAAQQQVDVGSFLHIPTDPVGPNWAEIAMVVLTGFLVLAGIGALSAVGEARRARNAQQMTELSRRWDEEKYRDVRQLVRRYAEVGLDPCDHVEPSGPGRLKEVVMKLQDDNAADYRKVVTDPNFLEDIAIMIDYGGIDYEIVYQSLGWHFAYRWTLWKPTIEALRVADEVPGLYENFQKIAKTMGIRLAREEPGAIKLDENGEPAWEGFRE
jgi:hypothetical protein